MTSEAGFFLYTLTVAIVCVSVYFCFRAIVWVVANGWRSMLGLVAVRAEAVVEWQDCDKQERTDWDYADVEAMVMLVHEATTSDDDPAADEPDEIAEHFKLWHAELSGEKQIARGLRRMERWSR